MTVPCVCSPRLSVALCAHRAATVCVGDVRGGPHVRCITCCTHLCHGGTGRYKAAGFTHLLAKPFDNAALREALHVARSAVAPTDASILPRRLLVPVDEGY